LKTAVVERERLGRICLNWGCIPTTALLRSSEIWHLMHRLNEFGFSADNFKFDLVKIVERSRKVSQQLSNGVAFLMKKHKIAVIAGEAKLAGKGTLSVTKDSKTESFSAKNIVLATGARARTFPGLEPDGKLVWTYREAMVPPAFPKSLLVVGSGAIGIEFASFFRTLGSEVTVVEVLERVLPVEDEEISALAAKAFTKQGMKIRTSATVEKLEKAADAVSATVKSKDGKTETLTVERVILAVGIVGNVENLGLEGTRVKVEKTHIVIDAWGFTGEPNVYAIGDIVPTPALAHCASAEGILCVEKIKGLDVRPINYDHVPGCTYCDPEIGSVGLTEQAAKDQGYDVRVGSFPFRALGRARMADETDGFVKIVADKKYDEILGVHIIGPRATELVAEATLALRLESTVEELIRTIHAHPTMAEAIGEAAHAAHGAAIQM
jgi:dihydrolipoamide dehydrogenase